MQRLPYRGESCEMLNATATIDSDMRRKLPAAHKNNAGVNWLGNATERRDGMSNGLTCEVSDNDRTNVLPCLVCPHLRGVVGAVIRRGARSIKQVVWIHLRKPRSIGYFARLYVSPVLLRLT